MIGSESVMSTLVAYGSESVKMTLTTFAAAVLRVRKSLYRKWNCRGQSAEGQVTVRFGSGTLIAEL